MDGIESVPIEKSAKSSRVENCGLANYGAGFGPFHLELKPSPARNLHLRRQTQFAIGLKTFNPPEIKSLANRYRMRISAAAPNSDAAQKQIDETSNIPEETGEIPSLCASDPLNRSKCLCWRN